MSASQPHAVLVTGSNSGFGRLTVLELARRGHKVAASARDLRTLSDVLDAAASERLTLFPVELDVTSTASVTTGLAAAEAGIGPLTAVVNNAGVQVRGTVEDFDDDEAHRVFDVNVMGPLRVIRAALPALRARGDGVFVNLSSLAGVASLPSEGVYAGSKHALEGLTEALFYEVAPYRLRVVNIQAGGFPTTGLNRGGWTRRSGPASVYHADMEAFEAGVAAFQAHGEPADPQRIATAIADAIENPLTPFRVIVGADAEAVIASHRAMEMEAFAHQFRTILNWQVSL